MFVCGAVVVIDAISGNIGVTVALTLTLTLTVCVLVPGVGVHCCHIIAPMLGVVVVNN